LILFNTGTVAALVGIGTAVITIDAGNHLAFTDEDAPQNILVGKVATGTGEISVWEA
jgi:hypothetical protein